MFGATFDDIRFSLRQLRRSPGFSFLAILTVALGIGSATAIFSIVDGVLLKPLPFPRSQQLIALCETNPTIEGYCSSSPPDVEDWAARSRSVASFGLGRSQSYKLRYGDTRPEGVTGGIVTPGMFSTLQVEPALGRLFGTADLAPGGGHVVVLSDELWRTRFAADRRVVGTDIVLDDEHYSIIGVLAPSVTVPGIDWAKLWMPLPFSPRAEENRRWRGFVTIGRLAPGSSLTAAQAELGGFMQQLANDHPASNRGWSVRVEPLLDHIVGSTKATLLVFFGAVAILVLVGCANVANLLVARSVMREREFAVRAALGARGGRLFRLVTMESSVLALLGGAAGVLVAWWGTSALLALMPTGLPRAAEVHLDARVLVFALLVTVFTGLLTAVAPAWRATRVNLNEVIKEGTQPRAWRRALGVRGGLVIVEVALAFVLATGAGLLARSFSAYSRWEPGFETRGLLTFWTYATTGSFRDVPGRFARVEDELRAMPGVLSVGMTSAGPLFGGGDGAVELRVLGEPVGAAGPIVASWYDMSPGYFGTLGLALKSGRIFGPADGADAPQVAIVNETLARRWFAGRNPVGLRLARKNQTEPVTIVGVVADVPPFRPGEVAPPEIYWPYAQAARWASYFVLRTRPGVNPTSLAKAVEARLSAIDPDLSPANVATMETLVHDQLKRPRFAMLLIGTFAGMATVLTLVGVYGVIAASVAGRTRELGVRLALGAPRGRVVGLVMREGMTLAVIGMAAGIAIALIVSRLAASTFVGVSASDPVTFVATALMLVGAAALACLIPARRAGRINPTEALRSQ